jgi:phosphonate transport system ATP-binding protein
LIRLEQVSHQYANGTLALQNLNLEFGGQHFTALIGPSGAGKSTLMRVLNGLVRPSNGKVWLENTEITKANDAVVRLERRKIGMVFQQFNLVKRLTAFENVLIGRLGFMSSLRSSFKAYSRTDRELAMQMLERVGMADQAWQRADTLSGGQQQRVGIARALAQHPKLILADEPISALDPKSSEQVMELLLEIQQQDQIAVLVNLHHLDAVRDYAKRVVGLRAGQVVFDGHADQLDNEAARALYYGENDSTATSSDVINLERPVVAMPISVPVSSAAITNQFTINSYTHDPAGLSNSRSKKEWK